MFLLKRASQSSTNTPQRATTATNTDSTTPSPALYLLVVAVAVLLFAGIFMYIFKCKKNFDKKTSDSLSKLEEFSYLDGQSPRKSRALGGQQPHRPSLAEIRTFKK